MSNHEEMTAAVFEALLRIAGVTIILYAVNALLATLLAAREFAAEGLTDYPGFGPPWIFTFTCYVFTFLLGWYFFKGAPLVMRLAFPNFRSM